jgi:AraC-like DNA-binding protein
VLRLHASLEMLRDPRDISSIALDLGFTDHSHFTAAFRRRFGVTPSAYRARASSS